MQKPTVCIATGTRADWGILRPLAAELRRRGQVTVKVLATNMHLLEAYGNTVNELRADGFEPDALVPIYPAEVISEPDSPLSRAEATGRAVAEIAGALEKMRPDVLLLLGDRYEMLGATTAAAIMRVPVVHLCGGEISEGAIDEVMRHAITKLSHLHLTATEPYRRRVIQMGEDPARVINTGSLGVWNTLNQPRMSRDELFASLGVEEPEGPFAVATYHPVTLAEDPTEGCRAMLEAFDALPDLYVIITYPNNDAGSQAIIDEITRWTAANPLRSVLVKSLGMKRYVTAMHEAAVVVGNSSSGIIEVPSAGTPVVNIGQRQQGRLHSPLVIDCDETPEAVKDAIARALDPVFVSRAAAMPNPYCRPDTLELAVKAVEDFAKKPSVSKKFHDQ